MKNSKAFVVVFLVVVLLPIVNSATIKVDVGPLIGVENDYSMPSFSAESVLSGKFQQEMDKTFPHLYSGNRALKKLYNELRYRLFQLSDSNTVICKDGSVIFKNYIDESLCLDQAYYCTDEYIEDVSDQLKTIQDLAENRGKEMIVLVTPSKADYWKEKIPDCFFMIPSLYPNEERGVYKLLEALDRKGVQCIDCASVIGQNISDDVDIFTETGIHWTKNAGVIAYNEIVRRLEQKGLRLRKSIVVGQDITNVPVRGSLNSDDDIWQLMNIFSSRSTRYFYPIQQPFIEEQEDRPRVFIQGGSFLYTVLEQFTLLDSIEDINALFYNISLYDRSEVASPIEGVSDQRIRELVERSHIIILEINTAAVNNAGSGFYQELIKILAE